MNCPACNKILKTVKRQKQSLALCEGCGGVWFESGQLYKAIKGLVSDNKVSYQTIKQAYRGKRSLNRRSKQPVIKCPRCTIDMVTFNFSYDSKVFLDKCPFCKGIWTDKRDRVDLTQRLEGNAEASSYVQALIEAGGQFLKKQGDKHKHIAIGVAIAYLILAFGFGEKGAWLRLLLFLTFPILCIFFGRKIDSLIKFSFNLPLGSKTIKITAGILVVAGGWGLLFLPLFFALSKVVFG